MIGEEKPPSFRMNPWVPDDDPAQARRIGKTLEELGELTQALARVNIQGINANHVETGKPNLQWLQEETADVLAQIYCNLQFFDFDKEELYKRADRKIVLMEEWEGTTYSKIGEENG